MPPDTMSNPGLFWFFFSPSGRLSRKKYMRGLIFWSMPIVLALVQISLAESQGNRAWLMFAVACLVVIAVVSQFSSVMLTVKRCHDVNLSGWFILLILLPFAGFIAFLYLLFARSRPPNEYGAYPDEPR